MTAAAEEPSLNQPFACDGRISEEKLFELLTVGAEYPSLDFKRELDLGDPRKNLEFIKDCAAMMNLPQGGYLVIGATDDGKPFEGCSISKEMFDSAILTQKVKAYVDSAVDIRAQVHSIQFEGKAATLALIYVAPPLDGVPAVMLKAGTWPGDNGLKTAFPKGVIYTREGSTNALVRHQTWGQVLHNFRQREQEAGRAAADELMHRFVQNLGPAGTPASVIPDFAMDPATFADATRAVLDAGQPATVKRILIQAKRAYRSAGEDQDARRIVLDHLAAIACEAIQIDDDETVTLVADTLFGFYQDQLLSPTETAGMRGSAARWLDIILRVVAIGAMAIRSEALGVIPTLVLRSIGDITYSYRSWLRHGLTMASRANLLVMADGKEAGGGLVALARELVEKSPTLRPDLIDDQTGADGLENLEDQILDSLLQFDLLWCCLSLSATTSDRGIGSAFYPSCAAYNQSRAMPVMHRMDGDPVARKKVFGDIADDVVATSIIQVIQEAKTQSWRFGGYWRGVGDLAHNGFVRTNGKADFTTAI